MSYNDKKCPACGESYYGGVCDKCGYIHIIMPNTVPKSLQDMLNEQVQVIKQRCLSDKSAENQIEELKKLKNELAEAERVNKETQKQIEELKNELAKAGSARKSDLRGVVVIEDTDAGARKILPIFEGENIYGVDPQSNEGWNHHIDMFIRVYNFKQNHFKIKTCPKGLIFENIDGGRCFRGSQEYHNDNKVLGTEQIAYGEGVVIISATDIKYKK